jgi:hypothetical protein
VSETQDSRVSLTTTPHPLHALLGSVEYGAVLPPVVAMPRAKKYALTAREKDPRSEKPALRWV